MAAEARLWGRLARTGTDSRGALNRSSYPLHHGFDAVDNLFQIINLTELVMHLFCYVYSDLHQN